MHRVVGDVHLRTGEISDEAGSLAWGEIKNSYCDGCGQLLLGFIKKRKGKARERAERADGKPGDERRVDAVETERKDTNDQTVKNQTPATFATIAPRGDGTKPGGGP